MLAKPKKYNTYNNSNILYVFWCFAFGLLVSCEAIGYTPGGGNIMQVKVVSLEKCSATPPTIALVREAARDMGLTINLEHVIVKTPEDAVSHRHIGSPTVQINGLDIDPGARAVGQFGVT